MKGLSRKLASGLKQSEFTNAGWTALVHLFYLCLHFLDQSHAYLCYLKKWSSKENSHWQFGWYMQLYL